MTKRKLLLGFFAVFLIGLLTGAFVVYAQTGPSVLTISAGNYPGAPSYTVWTEAGTCYAKDQNGYIAYTNTNASYVINSAIVAAGASIVDNGKGSVTCFGTIEVTAPIVITINLWSRFCFEFEDLNFTGDTDGIILNGTQANNVFSGYIKGRTLETTLTGYNHTAVTIRNIKYGSIEIDQLRGNRGTGTHSNGFKLWAATNGMTVDCQGNTVKFQYISGYDYGVYFYANGMLNVEHRIYGGQMYNVRYGTYMEQAGGGNCGSTRFYQVAIDDSGASLVEGFRSAGDKNSFYSCGVFDGAPGRTYDFVADNRAGNNKPKLFDCYGSKIGGFVFIHYKTAGWVTENSGIATFSGTSVSFAHGMSSFPRLCFFSFNDTAINGTKWVATWTGSDYLNITITVTPTGSYTVYWTAATNGSPLYPFD